MSTYAEKIRNNLLDSENSKISDSQLDENIVKQELINSFEMNNKKNGQIEWNKKRNVVKMTLNNINVSKYHPSRIVYSDSHRYHYLQHTQTFNEMLNQLGFRLIYSQGILVDNEYKLCMLLIVIDQKYENKTGFINKIKRAFENHYCIPEYWRFGQSS